MILLRWAYRVALAALVLAWKGIDTPTVTFSEGSHFVTGSVHVSRGATLDCTGATIEFRAEPEGGPDT